MKTLFHSIFPMASADFLLTNINVLSLSLPKPYTLRSKKKKSFNVMSFPLDWTKTHFPIISLLIWESTGTIRGSSFVYSYNILVLVVIKLREGSSMYPTKVLFYTYAVNLNSTGMLLIKEEKTNKNHNRGSSLNVTDPFPWNRIKLRCRWPG